MTKDKCFYCESTGYIKGKEVVPKDKLPDQMCPYCEIGQAVFKGYSKAMAIKLGKYDALKASHDKLVEAIKIGIRNDEHGAISLTWLITHLKQALTEAEKI